MEASIYRLRHQDILTACVLALLSLGVIMVQSASSSVTGQLHWQWSIMGGKHVRFAVAAAITYLFIGQIDYSFLMRRKSLLTSPIAWASAFAMLTCVAVLVPGIGSQINGARRWLKLGPMVLQPSELAKWAVVIFLAYWLTRKPTEKFFTGFLPAMAPVAILCLLVVIQDFGTAALIAICAFTMLLAGRIKLRHILVVLVPALMAGVWFIAHRSYRMKRLLAFRDPWASPQGDGYHMIQSLLSFSTGGIFGRGLGNGIQKLGYLPEDTTDFIFSVICEELGLFGAILTIALYLGIIWVAWQVIRQKRDDFGRMLAFGIASMIGLQAAINIAVATVSVPTKGLSLPLISAGGSGLVITCAALGLLCSTARHRRAADAVEPDHVPGGFPVMQN
ncbi:MAG TPA: putative peptidoglycan glycosyltransferase FtsW [Tepidisphaeraceae bacterium]|nr:putative peptidoglycan glycosyltransferase FtsW [Tepidisphaeraceae bacterium]